jgi:hypothetical protein
VRKTGLAREPGWVLDAALRDSDSDSHDVTALRVGKKTEALYEHGLELAGQLDRYSYGPDIRFQRGRSIRPATPAC